MVGAASAEAASSRQFGGPRASTKRRGEAMLNGGIGPRARGRVDLVVDRLRPPVCTSIISSGSYLGEDDIVRIEDMYNRT
jgi:hypothetical protein